MGGLIWRESFDLVSWSWNSSGWMGGFEGLAWLLICRCSDWERSGILDLLKGQLSDVNPMFCFNERDVKWHTLGLWGCNDEIIPNFFPA